QVAVDSCGDDQADQAREGEQELNAAEAFEAPEEVAHDDKHREHRREPHVEGHRGTPFAPPRAAGCNRRARLLATEGRGAATLTQGACKVVLGCAEPSAERPCGPVPRGGTPRAERHGARLVKVIAYDERCRRSTAGRPQRLTSRPSLRCTPTAGVAT